MSNWLKVGLLHKHGEGERWGVVTRVKGRRAVALDDAPALEEIGVLRSRVQPKGHPVEDFRVHLEARGNPNGGFT